MDSNNIKRIVIAHLRSGRHHHEYFITGCQRQICQPGREPPLKNGHFCYWQRTEGRHSFIFILRPPANSILPRLYHKRPLITAFLHGLVLEILNFHIQFDKSFTSLQTTFAPVLERHLMPLLIVLYCVHTNCIKRNRTFVLGRNNYIRPLPCR